MNLTPLFNTLNAQSRDKLNELISCIEKTFPLPPRFAYALPRDIAELSRLLTSARPERGEGYLSSPRHLSAYNRYFLPWNVYRLCKLFSSREAGADIEALFLNDADDNNILDIGAGPLSFAIALWISFPALRTKKLTLFCVDNTKNVLKAGKTLFAAFTGKTSAWKIVAVNARFGDELRVPQCKLITAINMLNEMFWKIPQADTEALAKYAEKNTARFMRYTAQDGAILIVEPGIPRSAQFLAFLKDAFEKHNINVRSPCPPETNCCARGGRRGSKWCHFVFKTDDAPSPLQKISAQAGLQKEKAALSFLLAAKNTPHKNTLDLCVRIISESFPLPAGKIGRYGCSQKGLVLLRGGAEKNALFDSGSLLSGKYNPVEKDPKTGALIIEAVAKT